MQERYHRANLAAYKAGLAMLEERWGTRLALMNSHDFGDYLTVKRGVGYERDYIDWLQWVMALLEERVKQQREERASE